ncbi:MAG TPA: AAA family ATPase [Segeticoccus sp.]|nr:AAA family ATPase [Segeticoccus sp.]
MPPRTPGHTLHGRREQLDTLCGALDRAAAGEHATVWMQGPAGIGKTRLLTEIAGVATERGFVVAAAQADELERSRPFGVVADALGCTRSATDPARAGIAALIATHEHGERGAVTVSSDAGLQYRVVDALGDLVEQLAASRPVLLAVDDLQWADGSSLLAIHEIRRRSVGLPVTLVGCLRPVAGRTPLTRLLDAGRGDAHTRRVVLGPLSEDSVRDLAAEAVQGEPGPGLLAQLSRAGGNALFVTELLSALIHDGGLRVGEPTVDVGTVAVPPSLQVTILRRLSDLPVHTVEALRSAAILGSRFDVADLSVVTGQPVTTLATALEPAITAGVVVDHRARLRFGHGLIHDAIYGDLPGSVRAALHREAGQRLADVGAAPAAIAAQLERAGDPRAAAWLLEAARQAAPRFPQSGVELYGRALTLLDPGSAEHDQAQVERADTLMRAGAVGETLTVCRAVLDRRRADATEAGALLRLGAALIVTGRPAEAATHLDRLAGNREATDEQKALGASEGATAQLWLGNLPACEKLAAQARDAVAAPLSARTGALAALSVVAGLRSDFTRAIDLSEQALQGLHADQDHGAYQYPLHATRGFLLLEMDRLDQAREELDIGRRRCEDRGILWPLATYQAYLAVERFYRGRWDDAVSELETSAALVEETGVSFAAVTGHTVTALIRMHRGDLPGAGRAVDAARAALPHAPRYVQPRLAHARALLTEAEGDTGAAHDLLATAWTQCTSAGAVLDYPLLGPDLVRLSLAVDDGGTAHDVTTTLEEATAGTLVRSRAAAAHWCRGLLEDAPPALAHAADGYAAGHRPLEAALTRHHAGGAFVRHGQPDRARDLFEDAGRGYQRLGAHRDLLRLEADLRAAGMPRGRRGRRRRPTTGWASLTGTERAVADLVADGLTNPQIGARLFVSRRTVQTHVSHIFTKLGLSSRAQLATEVVRHRPAPH